MKVNVQYAPEHFEELLTAAENGVAVRWNAQESPPQRCAIVPSGAQTVLADCELAPRPFGFARDSIWLASDWDSEEINAELAADFENSEILPPGYEL